jgi:sirohydrochlorin ferrochelatase
LNILLAHASPDGGYRQAAIRLASGLARELDEDVRIHFLDEEDLPTGGRVLPLFLGEGKHVTRDVRIMAKRAGWRLLPALNHLADEIATMLTARAKNLDTRARAVMLAPYRFTGMEAFIAALYKHSRRLRLPSIAAVHGSPDVDDVLKLLRQEGAHPVALQPALIFPGKSYGRIIDISEQYRKKGMEITVGEPLAADEEFVALLARQFREKNEAL